MHLGLRHEVTQVPQRGGPAGGGGGGNARDGEVDLVLSMDVALLGDLELVA